MATGGQPSREEQADSESRQAEVRCRQKTKDNPRGKLGSQEIKRSRVTGARTQEAADQTAPSKVH